MQFALNLEVYVDLLLSAAENITYTHDVTIGAQRSFLTRKKIKKWNTVHMVLWLRASLRSFINKDKSKSRYFLSNDTLKCYLSWTERSYSMSEYSTMYSITYCSFVWTSLYFFVKKCYSTIYSTLIPETGAIINRRSFSRHGEYVNYSFSNKTEQSDTKANDLHMIDLFTVFSYAQFSFW